MEEETKEEYAQVTIHDARDISFNLDNTPLKEEFICPILEVTTDPFPYVDVQYCESFGQGMGCKRRSICDNYCEAKK